MACGLFGTACAYIGARALPDLLLNNMYMTNLDSLAVRPSRSPAGLLSFEGRILSTPAHVPSKPGSKHVTASACNKKSCWAPASFVWMLSIHGHYNRLVIICGHAYLTGTPDQDNECKSV